jgi:hypothetical protein
MVLFFVLGNLGSFLHCSPGLMAPASLLIPRAQLACGVLPTENHPLVDVLLRGLLSPWS